VRARGCGPAKDAVLHNFLVAGLVPDKVAGVASEFQALADKRVKEINTAYALLKGRGNPIHKAW
jgi:hypothetical protein